MIKKIIAGLIVVAVLIAFIFITIVTQTYRFWIQDPSGDVDPILFEISQGASFSQVALELEEQDLIASDFWLRFYARLDGTAGLIRAGVYQIEPRMSYAELMNTMTEYTSGQDISITIPEGYLINQISEVVISQFDITQTDWDYWTGINSPLETHEFIIRAEKPDDVDLEGYLFPDTYRFYPDSTAEVIVTALVDEMQINVEGIEGIEGIDGIEGIGSIHELLTLASVIEKEVPSSAEMKIVADVFLKRLDIGMALQACSTVNYVTGKDSPAVSAEDLEIDSPYNTYMYAGLPPGPIANPGLSAIESVINPTPNSYYYFLATPEGETIYATTYEEHITNKARYLY